MSNAIDNMKVQISNAVSNKLRTELEKKKARRAIVRGGSVIVDNRAIPATHVVDMYYQDGDSVWVLTDEHHAIIVGV